MNLPTPRDDQVRTMEGLRAEFAKNNRRAILQAPTRSGKTVIACLMMAAAREKGFRLGVTRRSLFLAQTRNIVQQTLEALADYEVPHGALMDGHPVTLHEEIQVGSIQSLLSWCDREDGGLSWPAADFIFLDECHSDAYWRIHAVYPKAWIVGMSATPCDATGRGLGRRMRTVVTRDPRTGKETKVGKYAAGYDAIVVGATYAEMLACGQIVPLRIYSQHRTDMPAVAADEDAVEIQRRASRYLESARLIGECVKTWKQHAAGRRTLCFAQSVAHSILLADAFNRAGVPAEHVSGTTPDEARDAVRRRSKSGETLVVCNCNTLHTGTNWNWISCVEVARLVSSLPLWRQMAARGSGKWPGKEDVVLLDHGGVAHVFGSPDLDIAWPLDPKRKAETELLRQRSRNGGAAPGTCVKCGRFIDFGRVCPGCGTARSAKDFHIEDGQLTEFHHDNGADTKSTRSPEQKRWDKLLAIGAAKGWSVGKCSAIFKRETGTWPTDVAGLWNLPAERHQWKQPVGVVFPNYRRQKKGAISDAG